MRNAEARSHVGEHNQERVELTTRCRDCDPLTKVAGSGEVFGERSEFQRMHNGVIIRTGSYHGQWMTEIIRRLHGHHEPQEEKVFATVLDYMPESATMVELGSFWAYYSMWFHRKVADPRCILVEPIAEKLAIGEAHFQLNGMNGTFVRGFVGQDSNTNAKFEDWDGSQYGIPMVSVDGLLESFNISKIDILHADIQGAETAMLMGAERALRDRRIGYLFVSTHGCEHERCAERLLMHGYKIIAAHTVLESFSGDGLIVARAPEYPGPDRVEISARKPQVAELIKYHFACFRRRVTFRLSGLRRAKR